MQDIWMASTNKWIIFYRTPNQESKVPGLSFQDFYDILQHQRDKPRTTIEKLKLNFFKQRNFSNHRASIVQNIQLSVQAIFFSSSDPEDSRLMELFTLDKKQVDAKEFALNACKYLDICMSCLKIPDPDERKELYCSCLISDFSVSSQDHPESENSNHFFIYQDLFCLFETPLKLWDSVNARKMITKTPKKIESSSTSGSADQSLASHTSLSLSDSSVAHPLVCHPKVNVFEYNQSTDFEGHKSAPVKTCTESHMSQETVRDDSHISNTVVMKHARSLISAQNQTKDQSKREIHQAPSCHSKIFLYF
jgi:hypothetical protein